MRGGYGEKGGSGEVLILFWRKFYLLFHIPFFLNRCFACHIVYVLCIAQGVRAWTVLFGIPVSGRPTGAEELENKVR